MPKITDFGQAKRLDDDSGQTRTSDVMGTPSYMAPEPQEDRQITTSLVRPTRGRAAFQHRAGLLEQRGRG